MPPKTRARRSSLLLGVPVNDVTNDSLEEIVRSLLESEKPQQIVLLSFRLFMKARRNEEWARCLRNAALVIPTSRALIAGVRFLKKGSLKNTSPFHMIIRLFGVMERLRKSVYLLGSTRGNVLTAEQNLRLSFPGLSFVGRHAGQYSPSMEKDILTATKKAAPSLLLVGRGPKGGHLWLFRNRKSLSPGLCLWDFSCFEIFAGKRAPPPKGGIRLFLKNCRALLFPPWRVLSLVSYVWYYLLLVVYRLRKM